uniref:Carboxypeptidase n=1 Tax=Grammatophora oceanica TaxID=210454 RepID=A0A7S1VK41_9STRA|mmetsp:Transcript_48684/g.72699  ORF Transcript_48684/g.72699 Transcript_48684/m.72699 type:complete len:646 (+) Transcript_48684:57-1994(+)|eukprot:CAMPEP_0194070794 /NCGR_PEP_ID=MMETSP0009_2-20130614/88365_1 /TAXON_ID=210454 /ORGANISM="Grammatophora oceanica, Strain CCMP 410" /LENGTH=645 /DNA_ID=CAMNT_0038724081 /DNA_START=33 /DNA_END=1970 /DNA_ORIENTATION=+
MTTACGLRRAVSTTLLWLLTFQITDAVRITPGDRATSAYSRRKLQTAEGDRLRRDKDVEVPVPSNPDVHLVKDLPLLESPLPVDQWAGLLPASADGDKYFFYWLFAPDLSNSEIEEPDVPLLIWLNGGPGCSSMDGLWIENGPIQLDKSSGDWKIIEREHSWHKAPAYVVYIDQPVGTGLSFTTSKKYPRNDEEVNIDFYYFLKEFLKLHADKFLNGSQKTKRSVFFSGESHAGHYIPSMMAYIQRQQSNEKDVHIELSGAAIGNGWVDPFYQYAAAEVAYGYSLIGKAQKNALDQDEKQCQTDLKHGKYQSGICFNLLEVILKQSLGKSSDFKVSQYDARFMEDKHHSRDFPPGHRDVEHYLGNGDVADTSEVLEAIHALPSWEAGQVYMECTDPPYDALSHQDGKGVTEDVIELLDSNKVRLLFFNGVMDLICNHAGNELFLEKLQWKHRKEWTEAQRSMWKAPTSNGQNKQASGYIKSFQTLSFLKVLDAGHMVPLDVPDVALDMMKIFLYNGSFETSPQSLQRSAEESDGSICPDCPTCPAPNPNTPSRNSESTNTQADSATEAEQDTVMTFVIAHSWLGAVFAVIVFLGVLVMVRRRQSRLMADHVYQDHMELTNGYRDEPANDPSKENGTTRRNNNRIV